MLLLPYRDASVSRSLPVVTVLLVLACVGVLFGPQSHDAARDETAVEFYHGSGLGRIELPRYEAYLAERTDPAAAARLHRLQGVLANEPAALQILQGDARFLADLRAGRVVHEDEPGFAAWDADRRHFDELTQASTAARFALERSRLQEPWRFVTYAFLHAGPAHLLGNMLVLILVGPFVEAALGAVRFALAYLAGAIAAGAVHVLVSDGAVVGASGAIAATVGMLAVLYGTRRVPVFYWVFVFGTARIPAIALLPVWLINEGYQWTLRAHGASGAAVAYGAHVGGLCAGALLAWLLRPAPAPVRARNGNTGTGGDTVPAGASGRRPEGDSSLALQAQDAAARLDIRRATRLYRELAELHPERSEYLGAYLNVTLLGADEEAMRDAALRLLWAKSLSLSDDLRRTFLSLTQPKILKALPIDEHLRLARRLVRFREDAAALRVIDAIIQDDHLRQLYGRQLADCLLGLFTAYTRHGLHKQAEQINSRLSTHFPSGVQPGGVAPANRPPQTLLTSLRPTQSPPSLARPDTRLGVAQPTRGSRPRE